MRGAPGNTMSHPTSYWVPNHSPKVFVEQVDVVSGVGYDRAAAAGRRRRASTRSAAWSRTWASSTSRRPDRRMRLVSTHPGVTVDDVRAATGFELAMADDVAETRAPSAEELRTIREVLDPENLRDREVPS
jgi:acyl CoA:acetate/3-ketoacid CoA transferase beta subunit